MYKWWKIRNWLSQNYNFTENISCPALPGRRGVLLELCQVQGGGVPLQRDLLQTLPPGLVAQQQQDRSEIDQVVASDNILCHSSRLWEDSDRESGAGQPGDHFCDDSRNVRWVILRFFLSYWIYLSDCFIWFIKIDWFLFLLLLTLDYSSLHSFRVLDWVTSKLDPNNQICS